MIVRGARSFLATGPVTDDAELASLAKWMNDGGGLFATGDHSTLGEGLCSRIPRIGTMRAWSNVQGVPPANGETRIDTNRPFTADEIAGTEIIEFDRQGDTLPQNIDWVPWYTHRHFPWTIHRRPHPVLCHPELGPIDVMPDHPHEGVVFDHGAQPDVGLAAITLGNSYNFNGVTGEEYPTVGGIRPLPLVIARGRTLADRNHLLQHLGPCWVTLFILDRLKVQYPKFHDRFLEEYLREIPRKPEFPPKPNPCLSCPSPEGIEVMVLGGIVDSLLRNVFDGTFENSVGALEKLDQKSADELIGRGVSEGLSEYASLHAEELDRSRSFFEDVR